MQSFFIADTHFGHKNIIGYCNRPFDNIWEHDKAIISNWNSVVKPKDAVYHLGDFGLASKGYLIQIIKQLNGQINFIRGNHDRSMKGDVLYYVNELGHYHELKVHDKENNIHLPIILCHYPFQTWNKSHWGSWSLHGHCHGNTPSPDNMARLDVGVDVHKFTPISYEEIKAHMAHKTIQAPRRR